MRTRTYSWMAALALVSAAALSAQMADESQTPTTAPATMEETGVPAQPTAAATATVQVEAAVPTPEAGAVQQPAESPVPAEPMGTEGEGIVIERDAAATASAEPEPLVGEPEALPRTASPLALLALLGLGSSAGALGLRVARRYS